MKVIVTASDDAGKKVSVTTFSADRDDPWAGVVAGDFSTKINITNLGTHDGTDSVITFTAKSVSSAGEESASSLPVTVTKKSATVGDTAAPVLTVNHHGSSDEGSPGASNACGTGYCNFSFCAFAGIELVVGRIAGDTIGLINPGAGESFAEGWYSASRSFGYTHGCTGQFYFDGFAEDKDSTGNGLVSEIKDVVVTVLDSSGAVYQTFASGTTHDPLAGDGRIGSIASWAQALNVSDYADFESYTVKIVAYDALGHGSTPYTFDFMKYPL